MLEHNRVLRPAAVKRVQTFVVYKHVVAVGEQ